MLVSDSEHEEFEMNTKTVYGLICDGGDGSAHLRWFSNKELVDIILDDDNYSDEYTLNEGSPAVTLTVPVDFDLTAAGIRNINHSKPA